MKKTVGILLIIVFVVVLIGSIYSIASGTATWSCSDTECENSCSISGDNCSTISICCGKCWDDDPDMYDLCCFRCGFPRI